MSEIEIIGYVPGAIGRITELHATYYATHWDLGLYFEAKVATELAAFMSRFQPERDGLWLARHDGQIVGSIVIDGADAVGEGARLRWFILDPVCQGQGWGYRLMTKAMDFCQKQQFPRVYLTTFAGLEAARHLYEKYGFTLCGETDGAHLTGKASLIEQVFEYIPGA